MCALYSFVQSVVSCMTAAELCLLGCVKDAKENVENMEVNRSKSCLRRAVLKHLKAMGFNTGICKSRWKNTTNFPAGNWSFPNSVCRFIEYHLPSASNEYF